MEEFKKCKMMEEQHLQCQVQIWQIAFTATQSPISQLNKKKKWH